MAKTPLTSNAHDGGHHITQPSEYIKVFVILSILMGLTILVALKVQVPDLLGIRNSGVWLNNFIALLIAVLKALLVIWVFMGVKHSSPLTRIWVVAGFLTFGLMYFILADNFTRHLEPAPSWVEGHEGSALPRVPDALNQERQDPVNINVRPRQ